jgi:hypothetical protein
MQDLLLAFHAFVMADALLAGESQLSYAAAWLSMGWVWGFGDREGPPEMTQITWNQDGGVHVPKIHPPRWPRQLPGFPGMGS